MSPEQPASTPSDAGPGVAGNYQYWQQHGGEWGDEYDQRKLYQVMFHIQELMIADYMQHHAPAKVLEFGCGVGRHLRNLRTIPGLDVNGYDQSPTMVACCERWTTKDWIDQHIKLGGPTGRLPYDDNTFDIVYTSEVLIHCRPEDIEGILRELVRVCRGHILHIEISPDYPVSSDTHAGCWRHDLVAAYERIGEKCELMEGGYQAQVPWRVMFGKEPKWQWSPTMLALYRALDEMMPDYEELKRELGRRGDRVEALEGRNAELEAEYKRLGALEARWGGAGAVASADVSEMRDCLNRQNEVFHEHVAELNRQRWAESERAALLSSQQAEFIGRVRRLLGR